jgi:hypothetical protein
MKKSFLVYETLKIKSTIQAWTIQMTGTLDGMVILVPPNSLNLVPSSFSYRSWERLFV